jgi:hypothetical protein
MKNLSCKEFVRMDSLTKFSLAWLPALGNRFLGKRAIETAFFGSD